MREPGPRSPDALRTLLGDMLVERDPPLRVDGRELALVARPADREGLGAVLSTLSTQGLSALVCGGGTRIALGNPPRRADLLLSTEAIAGVEVFDVEDGVAQVRAGTRLRDLRRTINPEGWELALDPWGAGSSLGGTLASGAIGPRRQGFGAARDCVLGLDVMSASGTRSRCGGRVVKNVTGYDLAKLYTGSMGSLGVIESAWLRLKALPERSVTQLAPIEGGDDLTDRALAAARRPTARVAACLSHALSRKLPIRPEGGVRAGQRLLLIELAGDAPAVQRDAEWFAENFDPLPALEGEESERLVEALRALQGNEAPGEELRVRMAVTPSKVRTVLDGLESQAPELASLFYPDLGLVYALSAADTDASGRSAPASREQTEATLRSVERIASSVGAHLLCERLPTWAKEGRDVFGDAGEGLALMRTLKEKFDPTGVLNPGRFVGGL